MNEDRLQFLCDYSLMSNNCNSTTMNGGCIDFTPCATTTCIENPFNAGLYQHGFIPTTSSCDAIHTRTDYNDHLDRNAADEILATSSLSFEDLSQSNDLNNSLVITGSDHNDWQVEVAKREHAQMQPLLDTVGHSWSKDQDEALREAVLRYGVKNSWEKICMHGSVYPRSKIECQNRWQAIKNIPVKGPWIREEDYLLIKLVEQNGPKKWSKIASKIPGRVGKQCRERWLNHLEPSVNKDPWTSYEDSILVQEQKKIGNKWKDISKLLRGRSENAVKNRFNSLINQKWSEMTRAKRKIAQDEKIRQSALAKKKCEFSTHNFPECEKSIVESLMSVQKGVFEPLFSHVLEDIDSSIACKNEVLSRGQSSLEIKELNAWKKSHESIFLDLSDNITFEKEIPSNLEQYLPREENGLKIENLHNDIMQIDEQLYANRLQSSEKQNSNQHMKIGEKGDSSWEWREAWGLSKSFNPVPFRNY